MSPRAAWRLERLGFERVYDYVAGKSDWTASGLPTEGELAHMPRAGRVARRDIPTCPPDARISAVRERLDVKEARFCIVTTGDGVVLGRLRGKHLDASEDAQVEDVMEPGPTSVRFDEFLPDLVERMAARHVDSVLVTTPPGELVGVMYRADAERFLEQLHAAHAAHHHPH